jgi:hypothetical protein
MNWQTVAVQRLRNYEAKKLSLETMAEQIKLLEYEFTGLRSATTDGMPSSGSNTNRREEMLVGNIAKREELKRNYKIAKGEVTVTEKALAILSEQEQRILYIFFINRPAGHAQLLCEELFVEKTKLYHMKDEALKKFTRACYGVVEL